MLPVPGILRICNYLQNAVATTYIFVLQLSTFIFYNKQLTKLLNKLSKLDLLICDEWGYLPFDAEGSQLLFQVIADCYEKRSLILTTNIEFSKWNGIFYDDQLTAALIDRLVHHSHLIVFDRDSWRFEHSLMKNSATQ